MAEKITIKLLYFIVCTLQKSLFDEKSKLIFLQGFRNLKIVSILSCIVYFFKEKYSRTFCSRQCCLSFFSPEKCLLCGKTRKCLNLQLKLHKLFSFKHPTRRASRAEIKLKFKQQKAAVNAFLIRKSSNYKATYLARSLPLLKLFCHNVSKLLLKILFNVAFR